MFSTHRLQLIISDGIILHSLMVLTQQTRVV
jgi:hypothetical protein